MFLKLFKHDLIDLKNSFFTLFLIVGIVSLTVPFLWELVVEGFLSNIVGEDAKQLGIVFLVMLGGLLINFFYIVSILFIIVVLRNFSKSFYGKEGYFTLTLPISTEKNVLSKILSMIVWGLGFVLIATVGLLISIAIVLSISKYYSLSDLQSALSSIGSIFSSKDTVWQLTYNIISTLLNSTLSLVTILFCMTLAHIKLFNKHSILFTILFLIVFGLLELAYIGVFYGVLSLPNIAKQIITLVLIIGIIPLLVFAIIKLIDKKVEIQ